MKKMMLFTYIVPGRCEEKKSTVVKFLLNSVTYLSTAACMRLWNLSTKKEFYVNLYIFPVFRYDKKKTPRR